MGEELQDNIQELDSDEVYEELELNTLTLGRLETLEEYGLIAMLETGWNFATLYDTFLNTEDSLKEIWETCFQNEFPEDKKGDIPLQAVSDGVLDFLLPYKED